MKLESFEMEKARARRGANAAMLNALWDAGHSSLLLRWRHRILFSLLHVDGPAGRDDRSAECGLRLLLIDGLSVSHGGEVGGWRRAISS